MSAIETKKANCKNCYKCLRNCPVKAIKFTSGQAQLILQIVFGQIEHLMIQIIIIMQL